MKKKIILTGIQNTDTPHIGNIFGMILPIIKINNNNHNNKILIFIADLHALTQIKDKKILKINTYKIIAIFLSLGLKVNKNTFIYRQSKIQAITELNWYLNCFYPYNRLKLAHAFKDKKKRLQDLNIGIFTYPILMASDILLFNASEIIIGKDQLQHIEITRKIAKKINHLFNNIFTLPKGVISNKSMLIKGTDGSKMSKSKKNLINIFASKKELKNQIMKIKTNNLNDKNKKHIHNNILLQLYKLIANKQETKNVENKLFNETCNYKKTKEKLYKIIINKFNKVRYKFKNLIKNKKKINNILIKCEKRIIKLSKKNIKKIRKLFF